MVGGRLYLDASAVVKLVVAEPETAALERFLRGGQARVSNRILAVEVMRTVSRFSPESQDRARSILDAVEYLELDEAVAARAVSLQPPGLRSLDAIHLASALALEDALDAFVTYDARQADAARAVGLIVESPA